MMLFGLGEGVGEVASMSSSAALLCYEAGDDNSDFTRDEPAEYGIGGDVLDDDDLPVWLRAQSPVSRGMGRWV